MNIIKEPVDNFMDTINNLIDNSNYSKEFNFESKCYNLNYIHEQIFYNKTLDYDGYIKKMLIMAEYNKEIINGNISFKIKECE